MAQFQFNAADYTPQYGGGGMLPVGKHPVMIVETELKPTANGQGGFLALTLEAIDGPSKGVRHTDRLNLHNQNTMTVEIANKQMSAYCYVTGVFKFKDTDELCRRPFVVEIAPQKNKPEMTEVIAVYTSDLRKPSEVVQSGNAPASAAPPPPPPAKETAPTASPSEAGPAWGNASAGDTASPETASPASANWGAPAGGQAPWGAPTT